MAEESWKPTAISVKPGPPTDQALPVSVSYGGV